MNLNHNKCNKGNHYVTIDIIYYSLRSVDEWMGQKHSKQMEGLDEWQKITEWMDGSESQQTDGWSQDDVCAMFVIVRKKGKFSSHMGYV